MLSLVREIRRHRNDRYYDVLVGVCIVFILHAYDAVGDQYIISLSILFFRHLLPNKMLSGVCVCLFVRVWCVCVCVCMCAL